ncbi:MAG: M23 family metallopeptidase, partial [Candidatus Aenigmarchaeota archaeon]|nr:M23 family metallopeptidase [Candidatus Aenigmarchaeota archaeon]
LPSLHQRRDVLSSGLYPSHSLIEYNFDECLPKDSKKAGLYKNIEIKFEDPTYGSNAMPIAGEGYKFKFFLRNQNIPSEYYKKYLGSYIYDIKINKIDVIASSSELENDEYLLTENTFTKIATLNKEIIIPPDNRIYPQTIDFEALPSKCRGFIYFYVILNTEQISRGKSSFLILPNYRMNELDKRYESYISSLSFQSISSPGPLDVFIYSQPHIVTQEYADDFSIQINIKNNEKGFVNIKDIKLLVQRDYVDIISCEDSYRKKIDFSRDCNSPDAAKCIKLKINQNLVISEKNSYNIECKAKININKYDETEKESFLTTDILYLYNFKENTYLRAKNCAKYSSQEETSTESTRVCSYPDICVKYSCPDGYSEISGTCNQVDAVCCRSNEILEQSELVAYHPLEGSGRFSSCFGWRTDRYFHSGIDLGVVEGTPVHAIQDGIVVRAGYFNDGFGNRVVIEHTIDGNKYYSLYGHLKCDGINVKVGDPVNAGDIIGYSGGADGCSGTSTGPHLHFEIRESQNYVQNSINPCLFLKDCGPCEVTVETCKRYKEYDRVDQNSGNCDDPLT